MSEPTARITALLGLEKRARHVPDLAAFGFLVVNETHTLIPYRQAALWRRDTQQVAAVSGLALPERDAPYLRWLERLFRHLETHDEAAGAGIKAAERGGGAMRMFGAADLPAGLAAEWAEWLPACALWVALDDPRGAPGRLGALLLARPEPWTGHDANLLGYLADAYGHAWAALPGVRRPGLGRRLLARRRLLGATALALGLAAAALPVRQSVLAPAEVIATDPVMVRAPFEGVVDRFLVRPNDLVQEGQVLLTLDPSRLRSRFNVAAKALEVAEAELRQATQQAVFDTRSKASLAILQGKRDQHAAEAVYVASLLERIEVKAPRGGVVLFDDVNNWIGKPVEIGERILMVADPRQVEMEIQLPVQDVILLEPETEIRLFLNVDPHHPVPARLSYISYKSAATPEGVLAYRLKAAFAEGAGGGPGAGPMRLGHKGTAKLYGREVPLAYYLLRRPLAALRLWLGVSA